MKNTRKTLLILFGIVSLILAIVCFSMDTGGYENYERYGGDAYTGIQNAAAHTSNNILILQRIVKTGFGSVLVVLGGMMIALAFEPVGAQQPETPAVSAPELSGSSAPTLARDSESEEVPPPPSEQPELNRDGELPSL